MPQTVIKLKYTTARRICKAIFRQAPRAAVFPDNRGGRAPPRASCFAKRPEQLPVRSQTIGLSAFGVSGFRAISITGTGIPPAVACGSGRGSRELSERKNARPAFASASLKRMRREAGTRSLKTHAVPVIRDVRPLPCASASRPEPGRNELHMIPGAFRPDARQVRRFPAMHGPHDIFVGNSKSLLDFCVKTCYNK